MRGGSITGALLIAAALLPSVASAREPRPFFDSSPNPPRALLKTRGALTGPSGGSRTGIARGYLRDHARAQPRFRWPIGSTRRAG
jgi:hypothetical protein